MSFFEWEKTFKPITNHLDDNASFQNEEDEGIMFETYGDEIDFVRQQNPQCVWTYHDGESNSTYISNGMGFVNRIGYFVTEVPCPDNTDIFIQLQEANYLCENCEEEHYGAAGELHYEQFSDLGKCVACATFEELQQIQKENA